MKKIKFKLIYILMAIFLIIQFIRPQRIELPEDNSKDISVSLHVPDEIRKILRKSCYDCHSNQPEYPWYSHIMPAGWMIASDIENGREKLNFSEWSNYTPSDQKILLGKICGKVVSGQMPHWKYLIIHKSAELNEEEKEKLCKWSLEASFSD